MSCDLQSLMSADTSDPEQLEALLQQCTAAMESPKLWFWAIAFTVVGAVVGAFIGKHKKTVARDALLGAALGPIGWIVSLCLPAPRPRPQCPACHQPVNAGDAYCRRCGAATGVAPR